MNLLFLNLSTAWYLYSIQILLEIQANSQIVQRYFLSRLNYAIVKNNLIDFFIKKK